MGICSTRNLRNGFGRMVVKKKVVNVDQKVKNR